MDDTEYRRSTLSIDTTLPCGCRIKHAVTTCLYGDERTTPRELNNGGGVLALAIERRFGQHDALGCEEFNKRENERLYGVEG